MEPEVYVNYKSFVLFLILFITCIFPEIDKQCLANAKIAIKSSMPEFKQSCRYGVNLCFNFQISISKLYLSLEASQINLE